MSTGNMSTGDMSTSNIKNNSNPEKPNIPALDIPLNNVHLIEASAGTGKTWTLAALVLRLLLENKRSCEQIIATTFTRAAAAEMRQRMRSRIDDTRRLISKILLLPKIESIPDNLEDTFKHIKKQLQQDNEASELLQDPVTEYIIKFLLKETLESPHDISLDKNNTLSSSNVANNANVTGNANVTNSAKNTTNNQSHKKGLAWAYRHLELTLIQFDRMFVGTLDSLCQKLLREFAFDLLLKQGQDKPLNIIEGDNRLTNSLIHDAIRIWRNQQNQTHPKLMILLAETGKLKDTESLERQVNKRQNFLSSPLLETKDVPLDLDNIDSLINQLPKADESVLLEFLNVNGCYHKNLYGGRALKKNGQYWHSLKSKLITYKASFFGYADDKSPEYKLLEGIAYKISTNFSSKNQDAKVIFEALHIVELLYKIAEALHDVSQALERLSEHRNYFVCDYVHRLLPKTLEKQGKTTFGLQLRQLNEALEKDTEKSLATQIRHRYPVALIDEFQDVNADQAGMLYQIYQDKLDEPAIKKMCLLLVGDPKQAIYGFRGGDINNYQRIKKTIKDDIRIHTLDTNRRSQESLVDSLNNLFTTKDDFLENVQYKKVNGFGVSDVLLDGNNQPVQGLLKHISIKEHNNQLPKSVKDGLKEVYKSGFQLSLAEVNVETLAGQEIQVQQEPVNIGQVLSQKIAELLKTHSIKDEQGNIRAVKPEDIAVLYKSRFDVIGLEQALQERGIATFKGSDNSVFVGKIAMDMASIMQAMLQPEHIASVNRALVSKFFGFNQADLQALKNNQPVSLATQKKETQHFELSDLQFAFSMAGKLWQKYGFLAGWQQLAESFLFWQRLANDTDGERLLIDSRHLLEVIQNQAITSKVSLQPQQTSQRQEQSQLQEHSLHKWFLQQLTAQPKDEWALQRRLPSATGVQMTTIHKSKGLEYPIAFVTGMDSNTKKSEKFNDVFLTVDNNDNMVITAEAGDNERNIAINNARNHAEDIRVAYVAFTRPVQLLYVVTKDSLQQSVIKENAKGEATGINQNPLAHWLIENEQFQESVAEVFTKEEVDLDAKFDIPQQDSKVDESLETVQLPPAKPKVTYFKTWRNTSFSSLARDLEHNSAVNNDTEIVVSEHQVEQSTDYAIEGLLEERRFFSAINDVENTTYSSDNTLDHVSENPSAYQSTKEVVSEVSTEIDQIRFSFPRGANSGSFLHKVFEKLNFINQDTWQWLIPSLAEQFGVEGEFQRYGNEFDTDAKDSLMHWLQEILQSSLSSGVCLQDIPHEKRLPEMGFNLGLGSNFSTEKLSQHLQQYGFNIQLPTQKKLFRFLKGEIDLIYEHAGKFYILDYKSNHLGDSLASYTISSMQDAMNHAGYWLQASIYMLALHRYLKVRLADYDPHHHLGGVEYAFIRGMHPTEKVDGKSTGVISWRPSVTFIEEMDALFAEE